MGSSQSMKREGEPALFRVRTAAQLMKESLGGKSTEPLKRWNKWSKGTRWEIPREGTFDAWRWEKFISEFEPRMQASELGIAQLWLQKSIRLGKQGIHKLVSVRKNQVMYTWPPEGIKQED
ncbi:unnamed protein product, partial [Staurois parvus]